jgi:hypothetical protein
MIFGPEETFRHDLDAFVASFATLDPPEELADRTTILTLVDRGAGPTTGRSPTAAGPAVAVAVPPRTRGSLAASSAVVRLTSSRSAAAISARVLGLGR